MSSVASRLPLGQPGRVRTRSRAFVSAVGPVDAGNNPPLRRRGCKTVSRQQLLAMLQAQRGATICTITAETAPRMRNVPNPFAGRVKKVSRVNAIIGFNYENSVNRQRARNGSRESFEAQPRTWGRRLPGTPLVEHKGQFYLEVKVERSLGHQFLIDGHPVDDAVIRPWLPAKGSDDGSRQPSRLVPLDFRLSAIRQIALRGRLFVIAD